MTDDEEAELAQRRIQNAIAFDGGYVNAAEKRSFDDVLKENERLKEAIRRLADQDATLLVQGGNVIVTMDATLTAKERAALERAAATAQEAVDKRLMGWEADAATAAALRALLERTK